MIELIEMIIAAIKACLTFHTCIIWFFGYNRVLQTGRGSRVESRGNFTRVVFRLIFQLKDTVCTNCRQRAKTFFLKIIQNLSIKGETSLKAQQRVQWLLCCEAETMYISAVWLICGDIAERLARTFYYEPPTSLTRRNVQPTKYLAALL